MCKALLYTTRPPNRAWGILGTHTHLVVPFGDSHVEGVVHAAAWGLGLRSRKCQRGNSSRVVL